MATIPRCLCVILTLWMACSRPSALILPEASAFGAWWGTPESKKLAKQADIARRTGDFRAAEAFYQQGYDEAGVRHDEHAMVSYLNGIASCRLAQSRYHAALETWLEAKARAKSMGDRRDIGAIAVNLSSLYLQVWDFESALREAEEGRAAVRPLRRAYCLPNLLIQLGRLHEQQEDGSAVPFYRAGVAAAKESKEAAIEALGLDLLGEYFLGQERLGHPGHLEEAAMALEESLRVREKSSPSELGFSWGRMGELKLAQGNLAEAERYTRLALNARVSIPAYLLTHQRGEIRRAMGDHAGALSDFREAVVLASHWRLGVLPARSTLTAANEQLERTVFSSFVEAAAREALKTRNQRWAEQAFQAVELNRAASLRESLELSDSWHRKVPPKYWETLNKLASEDSKVLAKGALSEESRRLRMELAEMESKAGLGFAAKNSEIFNDQTSLIHFQHGLRKSEVLLSFHLGNRESFLWAVTRKSLRLRKIAARDELRTMILAFADAVRAGRPAAVELGERLYRELFGQLEQEAATKPSWLLSLEGALFEVPFAALVTGQKGGKVSYLVSKHSVQTIPGALLLSAPLEGGTDSFLGVGDPVYNTADPRWEEMRGPPSFPYLFPTLTAGAVDANRQLGRLVGSAQELDASASNWNAARTVLLKGTSARRDRFLSQLANRPAVIHLATHVIPAGTQALLAFGLGPKGESEYLATSDIAALRVPGAIVAMTGCDSGSGEVRAGAGLQGLTRAWQMAGASAVLATSWPVKDSTGVIFASFYGHLRQFPAAEALRLSQMEMLNSSTWNAAPSYWAAYQITGSAR